MAGPSELELQSLTVRQILILHHLLSSRSVSGTAQAMNMHQAGVSATLSRLRALLQDPILVRAGSQMVATERAERWQAPCQRILKELSHLGRDSLEARFDPLLERGVFRIAASDFLDPLLQPRLVALLRQQAPLARIEILPLSADFNYATALAAGSVDVVIGNWLSPPADLHIQTLFEDEIVCLVAANHPADAEAGPSRSTSRANTSRPLRFDPGRPG